VSVSRHHRRKLASRIIQGGGDDFHIADAGIFWLDESNPLRVWQVRQHRISRSPRRRVGPSLGSDTVDWKSLTEKHSLGWVAVRVRDELIGLVNVVWDGHLHARIQDLMVASTARHEEVGTDLVQEACKESSKAGCEWLHVDFEEAFAAFYVGACGFEASPAGLLNPPRVCPEIVDSVT
jgi:ribosomal protein S18 acetylase RimI-like enzyme